MVTYHSGFISHTLGLSQGSGKGGDGAVSHTLSLSDGAGQVRDAPSQSDALTLVDVVQKCAAPGIISDTLTLVSTPVVTNSGNITEHTVSIADTIVLTMLWHPTLALADQIIDLSDDVAWGAGTGPWTSKIEQSGTVQHLTTASYNSAYGLDFLMTGAVGRAAVLKDMDVYRKDYWVSFWLKIETFAITQPILSVGHSDDSDEPSSLYLCNQTGTRQFALRDAQANYTYTGNNAWDFATWQFVEISVKYVAGIRVLSLYLNGVLVITSSLTTIVTHETDASIMAGLIFASIGTNIQIDGFAVTLLRQEPHNIELAQRVSGFISRPSSIESSGTLPDKQDFIYDNT